MSVLSANAAIFKVVVASLGVVCTIAGWLFDRSLEIDSLASRAAPDYFYTKAALDEMRKEPLLGIDARHAGFAVLVNNWPGLRDRARVHLIRRTQAFTAFGAEVQNDIALVALDRSQAELDKSWTFSEVESELHAPVVRRFKRLGNTVFWVGVGASMLAVLLEFTPTRVSAAATVRPENNKRRKKRRQRAA